jgi:hypothetical protein
MYKIVNYVLFEINQTVPVDADEDRVIGLYQEGPSLIVSAIYVS